MYIILYIYHGKVMENPSFPMKISPSLPIQEDPWLPAPWLPAGPMPIAETRSPEWMVSGKSYTKPIIIICNL